MSTKQAACQWKKARTELMTYLSNSEQYTKKTKAGTEVDGSNNNLQELWSNLSKAEGELLEQIRIDEDDTREDDGDI